LNIFSYVENNPVKSTDPYGEKPVFSYPGGGCDDGEEFDLERFLEEFYKEHYGIDIKLLKRELFREVLEDAALMLLAPEASFVRSASQKAKYLQSLLKGRKAPKWANEWLMKGKVPPGHHVDHISPLSTGGKDIPENMRLQGIDLHKTHHKYYHPWRD
jgi:hypothetical protein